MKKKEKKLKTYYVTCHLCTIVKADSPMVAAEYLKELIIHQRPRFDVRPATKKEIEEHMGFLDEVPVYDIENPMDMPYEFYQL